MTLRSRWDVVARPRDRFGLLLVLVVTTFLMTALDNTGAMKLLVAVLNLAALVVGLTSSRRWTNRWVLLALVGVGLTGAALVAASDPESLGTAIGATLEVMLLGAVVLAVVARVVSHPQVTRQTILGATAAYLLIGQVFAWTYLALPGYMDQAVLDPPGAGELPVYYSYVTLTTLGFGDITPVTDLAQRITVLESLTGQLFLAILIARLVALYSQTRRPTAA